MDQWYKAIVERVKTTPPACLTGFRTEREQAELEDGGVWVRWALACSCGGTRGRVLGHPLRDHRHGYDGPEMLISPLAFECAACKKRTEIIDTGVHGYNGALARLEGGADKTTLRGAGERSAAVCPRCQAAEYMVSARVAHSHFDLIEDEPELELQAQDFFDGFDCAGSCPSCQAKWSIASFELA